MDHEDSSDSVLEGARYDSNPISLEPESDFRHPRYLEYCHIGATSPESSPERFLKPHVESRQPTDLLSPSSTTPAGVRGHWRGAAGEVPHAHGVQETSQQTGSTWGPNLPISISGYEQTGSLRTNSYDEPYDSVVPPRSSRDRRHENHSAQPRWTSTAIVEEPAEVEEQPGYSNHTVTGRKSRSYAWPPLSDPPPLMSRPRLFETRVIGHTGRHSGRNLVATFHDSDGDPRTRYNLRVLRGRGPTYLPRVQRYPACSTVVPGGLTLQQVCAQFPRHVWGTCLRMFIAEGWTGEQIYNALPVDFRDSKAAQRPWNYIQQGFTREVKRMNEEDGVENTKPKQPRRRATDGDNTASSAIVDPERFGIAPQLSSRDADQFLGRRGGSRPAMNSHMESSPRHNMSIQPLHSIELGPVSIDQQAQRRSEIGKQIALLLRIMALSCPSLRTVSREEQTRRAQYCLGNLYRRYGLDPNDSELSVMKEFTTRLIEVVERGPSHSSQSVQTHSSTVAERLFPLASEIMASIDDQVGSSLEGEAQSPHTIDVDDF